MNKKAFTLLEIIIVIIIIGVLTSLALPKMMGMVEKSRATEAYAAVASIRSAMERYYLMHGVFGYPCSGQACDVMISKKFTFDELGMADPGKSPNAHFSYKVTGFRDEYYDIVATRNLVDMPPPSGSVFSTGCSMPGGAPCGCARTDMEYGDAKMCFEEIFAGNYPDGIGIHWFKSSVYK